ncbi:hypothetical protein [Modicisalibacter ilicicola]|uniref:hypothetical protein n=1 Tax=Modicisalibacter ilicicola TaxID=480814 RepID=UPI0015874888|nr:hypothetical protein [Halomonas ilicicola]
MFPFRRSSTSRRRGATRRLPASSERWLNRLLDIAVASALLVGSTALLISYL